MSDLRFVESAAALMLLSCCSYPMLAYAQATDNPLLPQIVVTASRYEDDVQRVPVYVTQITRQQINESNAQTVNEAIIRLGGISARTSLSGGNEQTLDPMGFGDSAGSNLMILVDGIPMIEGDSTEVRLSGIPVEIVERIEIQKSSGGVLYGGGSTAGVINIITRASSRDSDHASYASVYAGIGTSDTSEYRASARYSLKGWDVSFAALDRQSAGYRVHSANDNQSGSFALKYSMDAIRMGLNVSREDTYAQTPGSLTLAEFTANRRAAQASSLANNTWMEISANKYAGFVETEIADVLWRLDAYTRVRSMDALAVMGGSPVSMQYQGDNSYTGLTGQKTMSTSYGQSKLIFGIEHNAWNQDRDYPGSVLGSYTLDFNSTSYFIKNDLDIDSAGVRVSAGYRTEQNYRSQLSHSSSTLIQNQSTQSAWELGVSKAMDAQNTVYARVARSYRFANIDEFTTSYDANYSVMPLLPQTSTDMEMGWKKILGSKGRLDLRVYRNELENEIIYNNFVGYDAYGYALGSNINLDPTRRQGADLDLSYLLTNKIRLSSSVSFRDARFRSGDYAGKQVPLSARELIAARVEFLPDAHQTLGIATNWISRQFVAMDFSNAYAMPAYTSTDLYYVYRLKKFDLSFKINNLFDASHYSYATRSWDDTSTYKYTAVFPDPGRTIWVSARTSF